VCAFKKEIRCKGCGALLGVVEDEQFEVRRGELQVSYLGHGLVSMVCYTPKCKRLNSLRLPVGGSPAPGASGIG
jgi:phage FluMu protein Com